MLKLISLDNPDVIKLIIESDVLSGLNTRLSIFTPLEDKEISQLLDYEYNEAKKKAEDYSKLPDVQEKYQRQKHFSRNSHYCTTISPIDEYLEGENGPPLNKGVNCHGCFTHEILKTFIERDYSKPREGWAYSMTRQKLFGDKGHFMILPNNTGWNNIADSIHNSFNFKAKSQAILQEYIAVMTSLYGRYDKDALEAKMNFVQPTNNESPAQRDAIEKFSGFLHDKSIPFYATFSHPYGGNNSILVYGRKESGEVVTKNLIGTITQPEK